MLSIFAFTFALFMWVGSPEVVAGAVATSVGIVLWAGAFLVMWPLLARAASDRKLAVTAYAIGTALGTVAASCVLIVGVVLVISLGTSLGGSD